MLFNFLELEKEMSEFNKAQAEFEKTKKESLDSIARRHANLQSALDEARENLARVGLADTRDKEDSDKLAEIRAMLNTI